MDNRKIPGQEIGDEIAEMPAQDDGGTSKGDETWLKFAQDAYRQSTSFFDTNYKRHWEDDLRMFNSKHPRDSKYLSDAYKYRSRYFRPKSRGMVRKNEAVAAQAFFSNPDVLTCDPVNPMDDLQIASAQFYKELMQYRLEKSIPWFITVCGAYQDALSVGVVASLNVWDYRSKPVKEKAKAQFAGMEVEVELESEEVRIDKPKIELIPVNSIKFHPAAKWDDVVGTSPYVILELPMYLRDVLERMEQEGTADAWRALPERTILSARISKDNTVESARNDFQEDPQKAKSDINEFDMVMVHLNFIKVDEETYAYWTLKDKHLLSDPKPVSEVFLHCKDGRPPVTIGFCILETHKSVKSSAIRLGAELQREANEIANQRGDNVKFVLNKRWKVRRGANVDVESIVRNVPGGVTMVNDVDKDIQAVEWNDVTASAYQEQDRLNYDYDALLGNVDMSSMNPQQMQNTPVGSMRMMSQGADSVTEYQLRTFVETWVEPTLRMLARMEAAYETDEVVLAVAGAPLQLKFGIKPDYDRLLAQDLTLSINVGMGSTDPTTRFQRFMAALGAYGQVVQAGSPDFNLPEVRKELFGLAGFRDNKRFFTNVDPRLQQAQQALQQAQGMAEKVVQAAKDRVQRREIQLNRRESDLKLKELMSGGDMAKGQQELAQKQQAHVIDLHAKTSSAALDAHLKEQAAVLDAHIKEFEAAIDAELKRAQAEVDMEVARKKAEAQPKREAA